MNHFSVSKEVYSGPCYEYPGFEWAVLLNNGTQVLIQHTDSFSDETGGRFRKEYATNLEALNSLGEYIGVLRAQEPQAKVAAAQLNKVAARPHSAPAETWQRLLIDCKARLVYLPDSGEGYRYQ